ncbi:hypothetical protein NQZ68_001424 [Dissostichus eleginoides]|nr:hypothetical protein NQZ68_001424 [Dissostichus eleginoides]
MLLKAQTVVVAHTDHCVAPESVHELGLHHALSYRETGVTAALFTLDESEAGEFPLDEKLTSRIASEPERSGIRTNKVSLKPEVHFSRTEDYLHRVSVQVKSPEREESCRLQVSDSRLYLGAVRRGKERGGDGERGMEDGGWIPWEAEDQKELGVLLMVH